VFDGDARREGDPEGHLLEEGVLDGDAPNANDAVGERVDVREPVAVGDTEGVAVFEGVDVGVGETNEAPEETVDDEVCAAEGVGVDGRVRDVSSGGSCSSNASAVPAPSMGVVGKELSLGEGLFSTGDQLGSAEASQDGCQLGADGGPSFSGGSGAEEGCQLGGAYDGL